MAALTTISKKQISEEKMAVAKTTDFLRKAEQLRKLVDKHEKESKRNKQSRRNVVLRECFSALDEYENKLNMELKAEVMRVQQQLQKIQNSVYRFQGHLIDVKPSPSLIEKLKDIMTDIESSISTFKEQQHKSFEELLKEERTCWQEMNAFERKIDAWTLPVKNTELSTIPKTKHCMVKQGKEEFPIEVTALETFLQQTGGKLGGWDQYDHQSFLKVWTKHHGKPSHRSEVKLYLPDKTKEEIKLHEDWYLELCHLQEKKKEAIKKWRVEKQRERDACLQREAQDVEAKRKEYDAVVAEAEHLKREEERRAAALRLEAWREQRKQQQEQEKEQRLREEVMRRKKMMEERRRQQEVKLAVEAHTRQKKEEEELRMLEKEMQERMDMEERRKLAAEGIKRYQERDLQTLESKLQDKQTREQEEQEKLKKQAKLKEKVEFQVSRDPTRLWKPTKGWEERNKEIGPTGGGPVYQMFHRAIPTWRQGL